MSQPTLQKTVGADLDKMALAIYLALVAVGWLMVYAVNFDPESPYDFFNFSSSAGKQGAFAILCVSMVFVIFLIDWSFWRVFSLPVYGFTMFLLVLVLFLGKTVKGNTAWFQIGGFTLQPSELAKFGTCLAMATYLSMPSVNLRNLRDRAIAISIFLLPMLLILLQPDTGSALVFLSFFLVLYRMGVQGFWYGLVFGSAALVILGLIYPPAHVISVLFLGYSGFLISRLKERALLWPVLLLLAGLFLFWKTVYWYALGLDAETTNALLADPKSVLPFHIRGYQWIFTAIVATFLGILFFQNLKDRNMPRRNALWGSFRLLILGATMTFLANFLVFNVLQPHQQERIKVWLRPQECDPRGSLYNVLHSKMAIGSGGLLGKGYLEGTMTKLKFVPEQSTDFIFCTIGEEQGFIGVLAIIVLFTLLILRTISMAERQRSPFSRAYAYCVTGILLLHFTINIGMTMGLFPIIGIPLPFVSYGGSSLIAFSLMIGVLLKLDSHRYSA